MPAPLPPRLRGFTVLELMVTLSVSAILLGLAVPPFHGMWLDSQRTVAVNALVRSIWLARITALTRHHVVSICPSPDGENCANQMDGWHRGWMVFANMDRDEPPVRDANEPVLAVQNWTGGSITANRHSFSFRPHRHAVVNGTVVFCDRRGSAQARAIIINSTGRPRVAKRDSSNRPLRCPSG